MYKKIASHPTVREAGRDARREGHDRSGLARRSSKSYFDELETTYASLKPEQDYVPPVPEGTGGHGRAGGNRRPSNDSRHQRRAAARPEGFTFNRKLERGLEAPRAAFHDRDERTIDWATAEELALATILADGIPIRMTGEDVERGTFSHRTRCSTTAETGAADSAAGFPQARASFEIHNSPLSENAAVGFEFGYNVQEPNRLVIWEAQYGDFINGAQVMLDQFVTSAAPSGD
jgi:2-oxoglutarate dehydrogenase E1 component